MANFTGVEGLHVREMLEACTAGRTEEVRQLLEQNPKIANCSWGYFSPLHFAVREGHGEVVKLLLEAGANAADKSGIGWQDSLLQKALDRGYTHIAGQLQEHLQRTLRSNPIGAETAGLIRKRDVEAVKLWLERHPEALASSDERGNTPLHWAVMTRQLKLIDYLLEQGADLEAKRGDGSKPIHLALEGDYFYRPSRDLPGEVLRSAMFLAGYLVAKGARYDIGIAAAMGDAERVRELLAEDPSRAGHKDSSGRSPLYYAARHGHELVIRELLRQGADPNQAELSGSRGTALHAAASGNHLAIARLLLEHGADVSAEVEASGNPVYIAMRKGHREMEELLYSYGSSAGLTSVCSLGRLDLAAEILAANPATANMDGDYGPLAQAASCGYTSLVRLLLHYRPELDRLWYANNYLNYACHSGKDMVELLLRSGADPNLRSWMGISYLHLQAEHGHVELSGLLLDYGADIDAVDDEYCTTPLGWAAKYGHAELAAYLLERGASRTPAGVPDWSLPAAWAVRKGHTVLAKLLEF